MNVKY